jgi:hypothetical protein
MTPQQEHDYAQLRDFGWEYDHTDASGDIFMSRWDRTAGASFCLTTAILPTDKKWHIFSDSSLKSPL